jgi:uncharacterized protein (TIGR02145 family)
MNMKKKNKIWLYLIVLIGFVLLLTNNCKKNEDNKPSNTVTDIDGNVYHTVTIGTQTWTVENLRTTKYNDGTVIPVVTDGAAWAALTTPGTCAYNNTKNVDTINTYGRLYNGYTVNTGKICPKGWHVPSIAECTTLINYLGGDTVAGCKLKESGTTHWVAPNDGADNSSGFTALPSGGRKENGGFSSIGERSSWWSSTVYDTTSNWGIELRNKDCEVGIGHGGSLKYGFPVRCVKDTL